LKEFPRKSSLEGVPRIEFPPKSSPTKKLPGEILPDKKKVTFADITYIV
jgi:hypothetical protein